MNGPAPRRPWRLAILFGGGGSTLQNLIDATRDGRLPGTQIAVAVAGRAGVGGIDRCTREGVPCVVLPRADFADADDYSRQVFGQVDAAGADLVCLAGWMNRLVLPPRWTGRVLNVHPAWLPAFGGQGMYGRRVHEAVLAAGATRTGCTVHVVDDGYDTGPIVAQQAVEVEPGDTADTLAVRVQSAERELYPRAVRQVLDALRA